MRVKLVGIHKVKRKLKDGSYRIHYYAWRGGPKIHAKPNTQAFMHEYNRLIQQAQIISNKGTVSYMLEEYLMSPEGKKGVEKTVSERKRYIDAIDEKFGEMPLIAFESPRIKKALYAWRDSMAGNPRTADEHWRQFHRAVKWACSRGDLNNNHMKDYVNLYSSNRSDVIWTAQDVQKLINAANLQTSFMYRAAIHLGARVADIRNLKPSNILANETVFKPSKSASKNRVARIPHTPYFRALLADMSAHRDTILGFTPMFQFTNTLNQQWSESGFNSADKRIRAKAGLSHLHFHDLRGTAATIKASQGYTSIQIAGMLGWSLNEVESMLNRYVSWNDVNENWDWAVKG